jgi:hypothetical protein
MELSGRHCRVTFVVRDLDEFIERELVPEERHQGRDGTIFGWYDEKDQLYAVYLERVGRMYSLRRDEFLLLDDLCLA